MAESGKLVEDEGDKDNQEDDKEAVVKLTKAERRAKMKKRKKEEKMQAKELSKEAEQHDAHQAEVMSMKMKNQKRTRGTAMRIDTRKGRKRSGDTVHRPRALTHSKLLQESKKIKRLKKAKRDGEDESSYHLDVDDYGGAGRSGRSAEEKLKHSLFDDDDGGPSEWIFSQIESGSGTFHLLGQKDADGVHEVSIRGKDIHHLLNFTNDKKFDIPYVTMYCKDECSSLLKDLQQDGLNDRKDDKPMLKWHKMLACR
ncbi:hypothetical protein Droror1_Dr00008865 [Drosera rotundifolia]